MIVFNNLYCTKAALKKNSSVQIQNTREEI